MPHTNAWHQHIFGCTRVLTDLGPEALWDDPGGGGGGSGAAGPLVGPAGVGSGAGMRGVAMSEPPSRKSTNALENLNYIW